MTFPELMNRMDRYVKGLHTATVVSTIIEAALVILIGVATGYLRNESGSLSEGWLLVLIGVGLLYILLFGFRTWYLVNYPGAIVNELRAERELQELREKASRQTSIGELIVKVIGNLNDQTCAIVNRTDGSLCDKDLQDGLQNLVAPILANTSFLLDTNDPHATVGVYLERYASIDPRKPEDSGIVMLKDDLRLSPDLSKDLFTSTSANGLELRFQAALREAFNDYTYLTRIIGIEGAESLTVYCSPMPVACNEDSPLGVLFIIARGEKEVVEGLDSNLSIFNRLMSNWIFRYDACVYERLGGTELQSSNGPMRYPTDEERLAARDNSTPGPKDRAGA